MLAVLDRCPDLRRRIRLRGIVPIKPFAPRDIRLEIVKIVDRIPCGIGMVFAVAQSETGM